MIYLIGAAPRCGKTTLAKVISKKHKIPWISSDTLEVIGREYTNKKEYEKKYPYSHLRRKGGCRQNDIFYETYSSREIMNVLKKQAKATEKAIDMMIACEIADGNDYIIEGYHITPNFVKRMVGKYGKKNIQAVFLTKFDAEKFAVDVHKSTTPNDWLLVLTKKPETFVKVGKMVEMYSRDLEKSAKKYSYKVVCMDKSFKKQLGVAMKYLV
ncbi:hypothetical protein C0581_02265 [Candidatus Parcubacteria bacterium]|nr:MAG: hypothetical protein C0581_02265 [Candidatus Parcubacteria bacterium]